MMIKHKNSASLLTFPREYFLTNFTLITTVCRNTNVYFIPLSVNPFLLSLKTIVFDIDLILFEHQPQLVPHHFTGIEVKTLEFLIIDVLDDEASFEFLMDIRLKTILEELWNSLFCQRLQAVSKTPFTPLAMPHSWGELSVSQQCFVFYIS